MNIFYSFGYTKNLNYLENKPYLKNCFYFKKNNFFFYSEKKIQHFHTIDINLFVIGKILNKESLINNYNLSVEKNYLIEIYKKYGFEKTISLIDGEVLKPIFCLKLYISGCRYFLKVSLNKNF